MNSYHLPLFTLRSDSALLFEKMNLYAGYSLVDFKVSNSKNKYTTISLLINVKSHIDIHIIFLLAFHAYSMLKLIYRDEIKLVSFFGWKWAWKMGKRDNNKIDLIFDTIMLKPIEYVFFTNMLRQYSLLKFRKPFNKITSNDVSSVHWGHVKRVKSNLRKSIMPSDLDKMNVFTALEISIEDYFNKLNQHLFGQMYSMYQFKKAYLKDSLMGVFLDTIENDLSDDSLRSVIVDDFKKYDVIHDKIAEVMKTWKDNQ